jgi:predicted RNA-binding protein with PIN domain
VSFEHLIVDGYNVVFRTPRLRELAAASLERARDELVRRLEEGYRGRRARVTLVFDGARDVPAPGRSRRHGTVRIVFSEPPATADDVIRRMVDALARHHGHRGRLPCRVVSSDQELARHARLAGGKAVDVEAFVPELEARRAVRPARRAPDAVRGGRRELDWLERRFREARERPEPDDP